jgi:hypothetical protein
MAEQSSSVTAFRALVMLICLILIPVAAFCGSSFPAVVKAIQSGRWPSLADFRGAAGPVTSQATEAPRYVPTPANCIPQATNQNAMGGAAARSGLSAETSHSAVIAASYNSPVTTAPASGEAGRLTSFPQINALDTGPSRRLNPVSPEMGRLQPLDQPTATENAELSASPPGPAVASSPNDQLKSILDRLRQLGATYFLLEPCGDEKREFRFYCRMSIGGNPRVTKPFWCFDGDPMKAMTQVLKQVEDWQMGGG